MRAYRTVVVGTDGSESSLRAVEKAGALAGDADAYQITGSAPTHEILRTAREHATKVGAKNIEERAIVGAPVESLLQLVDDVKADLLVVGNRGLNSLTGRLLGSVPSDAARKSTCDVLIVHTVR